MLQITNAVDLSIGTQVQNTISKINYGNDSITPDLKLGIYLDTWYSTAALQADAGKVSIRVEDLAISNFEIQLTQQEIEGQNLPLVIETKCKEFLETTYNWTINLIP